MKNRILVLAPTVLFLAVSGQGCLLSAPAAGYYVPDSLPPGENRIGGGIGAGGIDLGSGNIEAWHVEGDFIWDNGVTATTDIRTRVSAYVLSGYEDVLVGAIGPGIELKWTVAGDYLALLFGSHVLVYFNENGAGPIFSGTTGFISGIGKPGEARVVISPRVSIPFGAWEYLQVVLSIGMDIPARNNTSLRPEIGAICFVPVVDDPVLFCTLGVGIGVMH